MSQDDPGFRLGRQEEPSYTQVPHWATLMPGLSDPAYRLYTVLLAHMNRPEAVPPSVPSLAGMMEKNQSMVQELLDELEKLQLITSSRDWSREHVSNTYLVNTAPPPRWTEPVSVTGWHARYSAAGRPEHATAGHLRPEPEAEHKGTGSNRSAEPLDTGLADETAKLCSALADAVKANGAKRPKITYAWHNAARELLTDDGYTFEQVMGAIRWAQADTFWASRTITMARLKKHFDQIIVQARMRTKDTSTPQGKQSQQDAVRRRMEKLSEFMESFRNNYGREMTDEEQKRIMIRLREEIQ